MAVDRRVTTQDISWFLDLNQNNQLDLDPPYQRRSVWSPRDRRFFLDTIFRGYPSPSIFLHKQIKEGKTVYSVVDGKQRLETILRFAESKIALDKEFGDSRLAGKKWKAIKKDEQLARAFWDYVLPVEFTNIIEDTTLVNEVFDRLNRNSRRLTEQELRHAKYEGWFITFVESEAESLDWEKLGVVTAARSKRMRDIQFISELLLLVIKSSVSGFDQEALSECYAKYDVLADLEEPFDEASVKAAFGRAKSYLLDLEREASIITKYCRDFTNFYSLWALVALNYEGLPSAAEFAARYATLMEQVARYRDEGYMSRILSGEEQAPEENSLRYYQNSLGASTEPKQRQDRDLALRAAILGEAYP